MKLYNPNWKIFVFAAVFAITSGCGSDDDSGPSNSLTMNGESFAIVSASILGVSLDGSGHAGITLASGNLTSPRTLTINFDYFVDQSIEGDYAYPQSGSLRLLNDWLTNYSEFDGTTNNSLHLQEGELTIVDNGGNNYSVTMNLTMDDGTVFSGTYTGDFQVFFNNG